MWEKNVLHHQPLSLALMTSNIEFVQVITSMSIIISPFHWIRLTLKCQGHSLNKI